MADSLEDVKKKLKEMNAFVADLEPAVRAAAFEMLRPHYFGDDGATPSADEGKKPTTPKQKSTAKAATNKPQVASENQEEFFGQFDTKKPADNVMLIAAWLYSQYGNADILPAEVKDIANGAGLTVAARTDNTLRQAKDKGKTLFRQTTKGWQPTLAGEAYLKETFNVKKGTKQKPEATE